MKRFGLTPLLVLAAVATAMLVAASYTPVFPGDRALAGFIQAWVPAGAWAQAVTRAAYAPWVYAILVVSMIGAFRIAGWRAAVAMAVTFFALEYSETALKEYIGRPRPGPGMSGFSLPSGWALLFGSTVGLLGVLAWQHARGTTRTAYVAGCAIVLATGLKARVVLGAHWPSDVMAGYLLAIAVGLGAFELLRSLEHRGKGRGHRA